MKRFLMAATAALFCMVGVVEAKTYDPRLDRRGGWVFTSDFEKPINYYNKVTIYHDQFLYDVALRFAYLPEEYPFGNIIDVFGIRHGGYKKRNERLLTGTLDYLGLEKIPSDRAPGGTWERHFFSGVLSTFNTIGMQYITINGDGTWQCSGDCYSYYAYDGTLYQSLTRLTEGEYVLASAPIPAGALLLLTGLGFFARRRSGHGKLG